MTTVAEYVDAHRDAFLAGLVEFLRIPSVSAEPRHQPDVRRAATWLADQLRGLGLQNTQVLETGGHPAVYAEWLGAYPMTTWGVPAQAMAWPNVSACSRSQLPTPARPVLSLPESCTPS